MFLADDAMDTFMECINVGRMLFESGVPVLAVFSMEPTEWEGDDPVADSWRPRLWEPSLQGIGNVVMALQLGFIREVMHLVYPDTTSFFHFAIVNEYCNWMQPGCAAQYCTQQLRRFGASTRPAFQLAKVKLLKLIEASAERMQEIGNIFEAEDIDHALYSEAEDALRKIDKEDGYWQDDEWRLVCYQLALGSASYKLLQLKAWHFSEAIFARFLSKTLSSKLGNEPAEKTICFLFGACSCADCRPLY